MPGWGRNEWNTFKAAKRQPALELARQMTSIERDKANCRRDHKLEEAQMWWDLYYNRNDLRKSLLRKYSADDIRSGRAPLTVRSCRWEQEDIMPSEETRQFVIFKILTSKMLLGDKVSIKPSYDELHARERAPKENNRTNARKLLEERRSYWADIAQAPDMGTKVVRFMKMEEVLSPDRQPDANAVRMRRSKTEPDMSRSRTSLKVNTAKHYGKSGKYHRNNKAPNSANKPIERTEMGLPDITSISVGNKTATIGRTKISL